VDDAYPLVARAAVHLILGSCCGCGVDGAELQNSFVMGGSRNAVRTSMWSLSSGSARPTSGLTSGHIHAAVHMRVNKHHLSQGTLRHCRFAVSNIQVHLSVSNIQVAAFVTGCACMTKTATNGYWSLETGNHILTAWLEIFEPLYQL
jgi:hypothetical protein